MATRIVIARHGNTFTKDQTPTRVGGRTDLDLVEEQRGRAIGLYLNKIGLKPDAVFAAPLKRTLQTAQLACEEMGISNKSIVIDESFREIDYGPDENKTEDEVMLRLGDGNLCKGKEIIDAWNKDATVPSGWNVDPQSYIDTWLEWGDIAQREYQDKTILIVSSNGVIRFAPYLTGDFEGFVSQNDIKVTTGGLCIFEKQDADDDWKCASWNVKCYKEL